MNSKTKTHFEKVHDSERISRLSFLSFHKLKVILWEKDNSERCELICSNFDEKNNLIYFKKNKQSFNENGSYLFSFMTRGVSYFGTLSYISSLEETLFKFNGALYKNDKRKNYRLLTYPHYKAYAYIEIPVKEAEESNVIDLGTRKSQTGIFKNFLKLVEEENDNSTLKLRVFDLSVNGLALVVNQNQKNILDTLSSLKNIKLNLLNNEIIIPESKIGHCNSFVGNLEFNYKLGLNFLNVDNNLDGSIGGIINTFLRESDEEFEDFIK